MKFVAFVQPDSKSEFKSVGAVSGKTATKAARKILPGVQKDTKEYGVKYFSKDGTKIAVVKCRRSQG